MTSRHPTQIARVRSRGFTLLEVTLAIGIAMGILVVGLYFHGQATNLRAQLLEESDRIATIRLVMDHLSSELRNAFAQPQYGFTGDATSLRFVTAAPPSRAAASRNASVRSAALRGDLRLVTYSLGKNLTGTNDVVVGLMRTEQPLLEKPAAPRAFAAPLSPDSTNAPATGLEPLAESIRFLRLWYWDGYGWSATWDSDQLPRGVEINLGADPLAADAVLADYTGDLFRRVIYLPTSHVIDPLDASNATESTSAFASPTP
jgi:type II secretory pathway pseudopilin PulG